MIDIIKPALQTLVQDLGREGLRHFGIGSSGAMDPLALRLANKLVGNPDEAAGLELTLPPAVLRFQCDASFALTGADCVAKLDEMSLRCGWRYYAKAGQTLYLNRPHDGQMGMRSYLAVAGGILVPNVMGSRSTVLQGGFGGHEGRLLAAGDALPIKESKLSVTKKDIFCLNKARGIKLPALTSDNLTLIRVTQGSEYEQFNPESQALLTTQIWRISPQSNRMGYRLTGAELTRTVAANLAGDLRSHGVLAGVIQVTPSGQPIVLMADAGTTGGYPKMAAVIAADLWKLGQVRFGADLRFRLVAHQEARRAWQKQADYLHKISLGVQDEYQAA
ncbi:MAG: biotin-dependent carboxyltransferase family protein [Neisseriaceae bacterium]|nr:biotin-dependent carboxyltransferase family protein [Neisseriaceae bacterium]